MPNKLTVRSVADLFAFVPLALGFHPRDSLVLVTFTSDSGAQPHIRVDLEDEPAGDDDTAAAIADICARRGVRSLGVVCYTTDPGRAADLTTAFVHALTRYRVAVECAVATDGARHYHYYDYRYLPLPDGHDLAADCAELAAAADPGARLRRRNGAALEEHPFWVQARDEGRVVHADRDQLAATLVGDPGERAAVAAHLADAARNGEVDAPELGGTQGEVTGCGAWLQRQSRWLHDALGTAVVTGEPLGAAEVARVTRLLAHHRLRDAAWALVTEANAAAYLRLWTDVCRRTPQPQSAPAACMVGYTAWLTGNGALAWVAVDAALAADGSYPLARRLAELLTAGEAPRRL